MEVEHGILRMILHVLPENTQGLGIQILLVVHIAKRVRYVGVIRRFLLGALGEGHSLIQILAAIGIEIRKIVERQRIFRLKDEHLVIGIVGLGLFAGRLEQQSLVEECLRIVWIGAC